MPGTWMHALSAYRYPVHLNGYTNAHQHQGWFNYNLPVGDRSETIEFERRFQAHGANHIEAWLEVVFWKLFSQPQYRQKTTLRVEEHFQSNNIEANDLWGALNNYVQNRTQNSFEEFQQLFGFVAPVIAIATTFPAFKDPEGHPMADTRIANWVGACMAEHNAADPEGPQLSGFPFLDGTYTTLRMRDFDSMQDWRKWCVHTSRKLSGRTTLQWRARDVEMAVFYAWGGRNGPHFHLNPLFAL
jgi:hypothetical protein